MERIGKGQIEYIGLGLCARISLYIVYVYTVVDTEEWSLFSKLLQGTA